MIPKCPKCSQRLFQLGPRGPKLRTKIIIFNLQDQDATIICPMCRSEIQLEIQLGSHLKEMMIDQGRKLIVRKDLDPKPVAP